MVIIRLSGGLGNQMFQYAAGRATSLRIRTKMALDVRLFQNTVWKQAHEKEVITSLFPNIKALNLVTLDEIILRKIEADSKRIRWKKYNILRAKLGLRPTFKKVSEEALLTYQNDFPLQNAQILHLASDWQNEKYFMQYGKKIRSDFSFPSINENSINTVVLQRIITSSSVSIHVRRGDYLSSTNPHLPAPSQYYQASIELINSLVSNPSYYVFSDDIEWCKKNLNIKNAYYINHNTGDMSYIDMQLMSYCKHNIIANSSFSWWGAWLNSNPDKIVISPKMWLERLGIESRQIVPSSWLCI